MRYILLIVFIAPLAAIGQPKEPDSASINKIVATIDNLSKSHTTSFTKDKTINQKKIKENWHYFDNPQYSLITIDYRTDSTAYAVAYTEKYYFKDGSLIYVYQSEVFYEPGEGIDKGTTWAGQFYFLRGKLIDHVTLGHGRSERDDWDPEEEVLQMVQKRRAEFSTSK